MRDTTHVFKTMGPNSRKNTQLAQAKAPRIPEVKDKSNAEEKQQQLTPENGQELSYDHKLWHRGCAQECYTNCYITQCFPCAQVLRSSCCTHVASIVSFVPGLGLISSKIWFNSHWADIRIQVQVYDQDEVPSLEQLRPLVVTIKTVLLPSHHWLAIWGFSLHAGLY